MMYKIATLAALVASASAFVPSAPVAGVAKASSSLKMGFEDEIGAQAPLGFWDPLGLCSEEKFERYREVEMKHGRIAQLAILGHLVTTAGVRLPFDYTLEGDSYSKIPTGIAALTALPALGLAQVVAFIGLIEFGYAARKDDIEAAQLAAAEEAGLDINQKIAIELNNGRAAQMGILGLMVHEMLDNNPYIINSLLGYPVDFNAGF